MNEENGEQGGGGPPNGNVDQGGGAPQGGNQIVQNGAAGQGQAAQRYQVRYMDGAPGPFSPSGPESARSFFRRFRIYCDIQEIINNVQECARRLGIFLRDSAQVWLDNKEFANFADLEAQFLQDFGDLHYRTALLAALDKKKLTKGVPLSTYLAEIRDLVQRLDLTEASAEDQFLKGLPSSVRVALSLGNYPNFRALFIKAQELIEITSPFDEDSELGFPMTFTMAQVDAKINLVASDLSRQIQTLAQKVHLGPHQPQEHWAGPSAAYLHNEGGGPDHSERVKNNHLCYRCRKKGHHVAQCLQ